MNRRPTAETAMRPFRGLAALLAASALAAQLAHAQEPYLRFQHIPPERSFASRWVMDVTQDRQGFLWFASLYGGFARFDGQEFRVYRHDPSDPLGMPTNTVHTLYADPVGDLLWIGLAEGLVALDLQSDQLTLYRHDPHEFPLNPNI
jgi:ligand-binding sensor domain-containing protein